ncbi:MAG: zinc ABC transporter substrate-binding protein [Gammaproteobacteria bacterium]|nr:zinc ABC transporter substrate-binding protein [Gammaproteobacteria bacterium]
MLCLLWVVLAVSQVARSEEAIRLVVSIKPLHSLASAVMRGVAEPQLLIKGRGSPHHFSLKPSHIRLLQQADVLLWLGATVESSLVKVVGQLPASVQSLSLLQEPSLLRLPLRNGGVWHHDHNHGGVAELLDGGGKIDPHLWLDPLNAGRIVQRLVVLLSQRDPRNQERYKANAERVLKQLQALHLEIKLRLAPIQNRPYLVYHDAYQYFERRYALAATGALVLDLSQRAGAKRLRALRKKIQSDDIRCAFFEPQYDARLLNSVVANLPIKVEVLDPLGADLPAGEALYFDLMRRLTTQLASCLSD